MRIWRSLSHLLNKTSRQTFRYRFIFNRAYISTPHRKRNNRGLVTGEKVFSLGLQIPRQFLLELSKARGQQAPFALINCVKRRRRCVDEIQKFLGVGSCHSESLRKFELFTDIFFDFPFNNFLLLFIDISWLQLTVKQALLL